ncbi:hypothetical protein [Paenibacillus alvei]|uniref:hypothetical protein n=1 Tax=Paenibacillus alvei TaxID=44250 RepID=UPI002282D76B|nr:hypothetical protein [Paenibacillus alvei]MCY7484342.1 hypothetical protein [Paenibacillus alvei]
MGVTIKPALIDYIIKDMSDRFDHAIVNIDGQMERYPIHNTSISGQTIRKYVFVQDSDAIGRTILGVSLEDKDGNELVSQSMKITKSNKGFLISFELEVKVSV